MEFIFRDAKQYTGQEQFQGRSENKLDFHFNASLTSISVGKGIARNEVENDDSILISLQDVQTELQTEICYFKCFQSIDLTIN